MRTSRAYVAGLGTTGVLVACAFLMLAVVSALVAFDGWPGIGVRDRVESVLVGEDEESFAIEGPRQVAIDAAPAAAAVASAPVELAAPSAEETGTLGRRVGDRPPPDEVPPPDRRDPVVPVPEDPSFPADPAAPELPGTDVPPVEALLGEVVDVTREVTDPLGVGVADGPVTQTGQAVTEIVDDLTGRALEQPAR